MIQWKSQSMIGSEEIEIANADILIMEEFWVWKSAR
jgi:hypothetical protein